MLNEDTAALAVQYINSLSGQDKQNQSWTNKNIAIVPLYSQTSLIIHTVSIAHHLATLNAYFLLPGAVKQIVKSTEYEYKLEITAAWGKTG